jgi:phosphoribosyl 1,2-cyclic phosphodiesterase
MSVRFHMLASGSSGNAALVEVGTFGVLIDFGLGPRLLGQRMRRCGVSWDHVHAVVLTHTHGDHWQAATLTQLAKRRLPVYCHHEHVAHLERASRAFKTLSAEGLLRFYEPGERFDLHADCRCLPVALQHDGGMTSGFRFQGPDAVFGSAWAIGYAADLGCWSPELARHFADVDVLALEFNHDVPMQLESGRHPQLIRRVLGDSGHLSNEQAADLIAAILQISEPGRLRHVVQLHLSRECNRPALAQKAAQQVLERHGSTAPIHTADQENAGPTISLGAPAAPPRPRRPPRQPAAFVQPLLAWPE